MPKVVRFYTFGGPEQLRLEDAGSQGPGEGEVQLQVLAAGLNRAELLYLRGQFGEAVFPSRIGHEAAGRVTGVGAGVDASLVGKQVATLGGFSQSRHGVLGEEAVVPVAAVAEYPGNLSPVQGASIWTQYLTAWGALVHHARVTSGDFVIVPAASSSVGLAAVQIVKDAGATAIAATRTSEKRPELLALGADHVIATSEEDLPARVREITGGRGARVVFDPVGGPYVEKLAEAAAPGGTVFLYGALSGRPTAFPLMTCMVKGLSLRGYSMREVRNPQEVLDAGLNFVRERLRDGRFVPQIARTFPLAQMADGYRFLESNAQVGKVVVTV